MQQGMRVSTHILGSKRKARLGMFAFIKQKHARGIDSKHFSGCMTQFKEEMTNHLLLKCFSSSPNRDIIHIIREPVLKELEFEPSN
jgi:hypothetical protein